MVKKSRGVRKHFVNTYPVEGVSKMHLVLSVTSLFSQYLELFVFNCLIQVWVMEGIYVYVTHRIIIIKSKYQIFPLLSNLSVVVCLSWLYYRMLPVTTVKWNLSITTTSYNTSLSSRAHSGGPGSPGWALEDREREWGTTYPVCINHFTKWKSSNRLHYKGGRYWQILLYIYIPGNFVFYFHHSCAVYGVCEYWNALRPEVVFVWLQITSHYHHYEVLSECTEHVKCLSCIFCRVCV